MVRVKQYNAIKKLNYALTEAGLCNIILLIMVIIKYMMLVIVIFAFSQSELYAFSSKELSIMNEISVSEIYDDNIDFSKENEKSDFITNLNYAFGLKLEKKTLDIKLKGLISSKLFAKYDKFNNFSEDVEFSAKKQLCKKAYFTVKNKFSHTYEPCSFAEAFGIKPGQYGYYRNKFNITYEREIGKRISLSTLYDNEMDKPSRADIKNSYLNRGAFEANYILNTKTSLITAAGFEQRKFKDKMDASSGKIVFGLRRNIKPRLSFEIRTGAYFINSYLENKYIKPLGLMLMHGELNEKTELDVYFLKEPSLRPYRQAVFEYWQTGFFLKRQLSKKAKGFISFFYGQGDYLQLDISDESKGIEAGINYDIKDNLKGEFKYKYSNLDSTDKYADYHKNSFIFSLKTEF